MAPKRLRMKQLRDILRLKHENDLPQREIARACGVGLGTVSEYLNRAQRAGLSWPLPEDLDDTALEAMLLSQFAGAETPRTPPDFPWIHQELKRPGVTLQLLWVEYLEVHPGGYRYSQFCERYRRFAKKLNPSMRQIHRAGEKTFVDFSGKRPTLVDPKTGEVYPVELFVGALGCSHYFYAEATASQELECWIGAHIRMVEWFGASSAVWVPDNLESGITTPCRYEPGVNRTYEDCARHYGAVVIPARPAKPRDKDQSAKRSGRQLIGDKVFSRSGVLSVAHQATLADAICDRIVHRAHKIDLKGPSIREVRSPLKKKDKKEQG